MENKLNLILLICLLGLSISALSTNGSIEYGFNGTLVRRTPNPPVKQVLLCSGVLSFYKQLNGTTFMTGAVDYPSGTANFLLKGIIHKIIAEPMRIIIHYYSLKISDTDYPVKEATIILQDKRDISSIEGIVKLEKGTATFHLRAIKLTPLFPDAKLIKIFRK